MRLAVYGILEEKFRSKQEETNAPISRPEAVKLLYRTFSSKDSVYEDVMENVDKINTQDEKIKQLVKILKDYEITPKFDAQMDELYHMGYQSKKL